jgi:hypothetical protein
METNEPDRQTENGVKGESDAYAQLPRQRGADQLAPYPVGRVEEELVKEVDRIATKAELPQPRSAGEP